MSKEFFEIVMLVLLRHKIHQDPSESRGDG
jgi:hypothetical protein